MECSLVRFDNKTRMHKKFGEEEFCSDRGGHGYIIHMEKYVVRWRLVLIFVIKTSDLSM